ncbi:MAG TPA: DUF1707 domain-containing protein [Propionibacteriaceae bacterium]|jgi:hypothetical protein|nr:DUF1707 domain-containing protein [Propionibacteriaceae bacterium]
MAEFKPLRIGDDERNKAVELLSEHLTHGRLTQTEFNDRLSIALQAKTPEDIEQLFEDLPGPNPGRPDEMETIEEQERRRAAELLEQAKTVRQVQARIDPKWLAALGVATGLAWTACLIIYFSLYQDWKIFIVPLALTIALVKVKGSVR